MSIGQKHRKKYTSSDNILVRMKNKICRLLGIDVVQMKCFIEDYVHESSEGPSSKSNMTKANTYSELTRDTMTFKVFVKFLRIIRAKEVTLTVRITDEDGRTVEAEETISFLIGKNRNIGDKESS